MSRSLNPEAMLPADFVAFTHEGVLLGYDPLTGRGMKWITRYKRWNPITPSTTSRGRTQVRINSVKQLWHRIVARHFINGGEPIHPDLEVDHIQPVDSTASQDRLINLRVVSHRENMQNRRDGSSKYAGVNFNKSRGKWLSVAKNPSTGKSQNLGYFTDERKAASAYIDFCIRHSLPHAVALERLAAA